MERSLYRLCLAAACALVLAAVPARSTEEERQASRRLTAEAVEFLDQLLGPGRSRAIVDVHGETSEIRTESEVTTPIKQKPPADKGADPKILPGYVDNSDFRTDKKEGPGDIIDRKVERALRRTGLAVKRIQASVVLDRSLSDAQVSAVRKLLPDLLHLDGDRGDTMSVLQAPLETPTRQAWLRLMNSPDGIKTALRLGGALLVTAWLTLAAYVIVLRAVKTFVRELAAARGAPAAAAGQPVPAPVSLPDLDPNGVPALDEERSVSGAGAEGSRFPALSTRFDVFELRPAEEVAVLISREPAKDLAIVFAYLAGSNPTLATRIFVVLPPAVQAGVSQELVKLSRVEPEELSALEERMRGLVSFGVRGPERLSQIFNRLPSDRRNALMGDLLSRDSAAAESLETFLFPFERLVDLEDADLRRVISAAAFKDWGVALRGASKEMSGRVLALLPSGPRGLLAEAIESPQAEERVMESRSRILTTAFELESSGAISLKRAASRGVV
ncbi:MAG: hypothetical protein HY078_03750 [Elusimicrobia bacterium]|nr:hypothetical protein [Elusimicrobiota bacterium]